MCFLDILKKTLFIARSLDDFENYLTPGVDYPIIANTGSEEIFKKYPHITSYQNISLQFLFYDTPFFSELLYSRNKIQHIDFDYVWMHRAYPWLDDLKVIGKTVFAINFSLYERLNSKFDQYRLLNDYCNTSNIFNFIKEKEDRYSTHLFYKDPENFRYLAKIYGLPFVMAGSLSDAGNRIFLINNEEEYRKFLFFIASPVVRIEQYIPDAISLSQFAVVFADKSVVCYQPNIQFISNAVHKNNFAFIGAEYHVDAFVPPIIQEKQKYLTRRIGEFLHSQGYLGMFGCDYMYHDDNLYFMELNPRYHASTFLISRCADYLWSPHTLHIMAFLYDKKPEYINTDFIKILGADDPSCFVRSFRKKRTKNFRAPEKEIRIPGNIFKGYELFNHSVIETPFFPVKLNLRS